MNPCPQEPEGATDGADKYPGMGQWDDHGRVFTEPLVYSVLPSNTLAYTIQKLLASKSCLFCCATILTFHSQRTSTIRDGR